MRHQSLGATVQNSSIPDGVAIGEGRDDPASARADASGTAEFAARLPRIGPDQATAASIAYGLRCASAFSVRDQVYRWRWSYRTGTPPASEFAELASPGCRVWIAVTEDRGLVGSSFVDWHELRGEARLLAWTLRYELLVAHLGRLLGVSFEPVALVPAGEHQRSELGRLGFAVFGPTGSEVGRGIVVWDGPLESDRLAGDAANAIPDEVLRGVA
ncbi:MAG: hypothetical protein ACREEP_00025, partial [Dongiaceae bacterium]